MSPFVSGRRALIRWFRSLRGVKRSTGAGNCQEIATIVYRFLRRCRLVRLAFQGWAIRPCRGTGPDLGFLQVGETQGRVVRQGQVDGSGFVVGLLVDPFVVVVFFVVASFVAVAFSSFGFLLNIPVTYYF